MKAHELISDPKRFRQGSLAYDAKGHSCGTLRDSGDVAFDALGAIFWCYPDGKHNEQDQRDEQGRKTGLSPCARAREYARARFDCQLGRLDWEEALTVLKAVDV